MNILVPVFKNCSKSSTFVVPTFDNMMQEVKGYKGCNLHHHSISQPTKSICTSFEEKKYFERYTKSSTLAAPTFDTMIQEVRATRLLKRLATGF